MYYKGIYDDHARAMREVKALQREVHKLLSIYENGDDFERERTELRVEMLTEQIDYWQRQAEALEQGML